MTLANNNTKRIKETLRIRRAVQLVWAAAPGWTALNCVVVTLQGILPLASLVVLRRCIDLVSKAASNHSPSMYHQVIGAVGLLGGIALATSVLRSLSALVSQRQAEMVTDRVHDILHKKSVDVDLSFYENSRYYDTLHRAQVDSPVRPTRIVNNLVQIAQSAISLAAIAALLLSNLGAGFALLMIAATVPGVLGKLVLARSTFLWQRRKTATERRVAYFNWMLTGDNYAKEVRLFGLGSHFMWMSQRLRSLLRTERMAIAGRRALVDVVAQGCAVAALFASFGYLAFQTAHGAYTLGALIMFFQAFQRGQSSLQDMLAGVSELYENNLYLANLFEFLDLKSTIESPASPAELPAHGNWSISLDHVSFRYDDAADDVLKDITLTIRPGETIALVGHNGSGKTTLVKLLCRLYDPTGGSIKVDGIDIRQLSPDEYRRKFSVVFQDFAHYYLPARDNVWFGDINQSRETERVQVAAQRSGAAAVIDGLKDGYDTVLGYAYDEGQELSIGQWQKIALARAFMRDSEIMIMDEPTSALDPEAEQEVFAKFGELAENRTAIIISHRLSTVRMADRIYLLEDGRIAEYGNHSELISLNGKYAQFYEAQASNYVEA